MQFGYLPRPDFSLSNMSEQNFPSAISLDLETDFEERPAAIRAMSKTVVTADENLVRTHCAKRRVTSDGREVKMWECGLCGKEFKFQYTLSRHIPTHTDVRNYRCDICPKAFRQLSTLAQHKVTHKDERPYVCENCGKAFNRVSTLMSHKRTHYDDKRHVCKYCGKGFHQKGNLRNHVNTHTDERPFKCDVCNKGFNQQSNLVCHKENAHPKKSHFCEKCLTIFPRRSSFLSHMRKHHVRRGESQPVSVITVKSTSEAHSNKTFNNNDGEMILPDPEIPSTSTNCPTRSFNDTKDWTNITVKPITSSHPSRLNVPWQENPGLSPQKQEHCVKLRIKEEPDAAWIEPILGSLTPLKVEVYVKQEEQTSSLPYVKPQEQTSSLLSVKPEEQTSSVPEVLSPIDPLLAIGLSEFKENPESYNPHNVQVQKLLNIPEEVDFETALLNDINKPFDIGDFEFFDDLM